MTTPDSGMLANLMVFKKCVMQNEDYHAAPDMGTLHRSAPRTGLLGLRTNFLLICQPFVDSHLGHP